MNDLDWLAKRRFQEAIRNEYSWTFAFDHGVSVKAECLWRLTEKGRIKVTNQDDGHQFGLPARVDAVLEVNQRLAGAPVTSVALREGTLDLEIQFDTGHRLQLIPDSAGYEAWAVYEPSREFIAVGGGELTSLGHEP
jgi:hypothetical protein